MKILYCSDKYAHNVMGTKRSIFEEVGRRGYDIQFLNISIVSGNFSAFFAKLEEFQPDQIWFAHSNLVIPAAIKAGVSAPIIGFGFSDPYYFSPSRFASYDAYVTNHYDTLEKFRNQLPMHYNPTACDLAFHKQLPVEKEYAASLIGLATHPRFNNKNERREFIGRLREDAPDLKVIVFGRGWQKGPLNFGHIEGEPFLKVINHSQLGLDIQDDWSPLAHRMFEYSACGTPVITRRRPEVFRFFKEDIEILAYDDYDEFRDKVISYCREPEKLAQIGSAAKYRCEKEHDIKYRVEAILKFAESLS